MPVWVTSDQHFWHRNIIRLCSRINPETALPFVDEYEMNDLMVRYWNSVVKKGDVVWHLGDLGYAIKGRDAEMASLLESLNGEIHLVRGNHDHYPEEWYLSHNIVEVVPYKVINGVLLSHYPLFDDVHDRKEMQIDKLELLFQYNKHKCWFHLYGHAHEHPSPVANALNMSVELWNYMPVQAMYVMPHIGRYKAKFWS